MKKALVIFMSLIVSVMAFSGCNSSQSGGNSSAASTESAAVSDSSPAETSSGTSGETSQTSSQTSTAVSESSYFSDADYKDVSSETPHAEIVFSGSEATISDTTRGSVSGKTVTITSKGIYKISGNSDDVSIVIDDSTKSGNIYLILDNVTMTTSSAPCIYVKNADKVLIQSTESSSLTFNGSSSAKEDAAIYAKDDVTINGSGVLNITSNLHGIVCKDDLKITGSTLNVKAESIGIKSEGTVRIGGGTILVESGHDGIQIENDDNDASFYFEKASAVISSGYDGISVKSGDSNKTFTGFVELNGGTLTILTASGKGSDASKDKNTSQKGIKTDGNITIAETLLTISAADDAIHGNANITIKSGQLGLSSSDDGITAAGDLTIDGGAVVITKSYEGLEAENVTINNGTVSVTASDDGINCSGGSDTSSNDDNPWSSGNTSAKLTINNGTVHVDAEGDGLDSNGSIYITGGTVIVEGPSSAGNGAIDKGDSADCVASITGGTVLAIGTSDMAVNFDSGTQCSALVSLSGTSGTVITVNDGSDFSFTSNKSYSSIVYSSPNLKEGSTYTITSGDSTATVDFTSGLYFSNVATRGMGGRP